MLEVTATNQHIVSAYGQPAIGQIQPRVPVRPVEESVKSNTRQNTTYQQGSPDDTGTTNTPHSDTSGKPYFGRPVLTPAEKYQIQKLMARDRQVRAHEQAHLSAAAGIAKGGASFRYMRGPDGRMYATGGEVSIDASEVAGDPEATLRKANQIRAAALAPAHPSTQDLSVAAKASRMAVMARAEIITGSLEDLAKTNNNQNSRLVRSYEENVLAGVQQSPALNRYE